MTSSYSNHTCHGASPPDPEKSGAIPVEAIPHDASADEHIYRSEPITLPSTTLGRWNAWIESLAGFEARGISRVMPDERHQGSILGYLQMAILWFSANVTVNNLAVGLLGPLVFDLGFVDSAMCAVFGTLVGSLPTAYMSTWGAQSGNRTMIVTRYFFGYWPAKIICFLNMIIMVGYNVLSAIIAGQMLSAVSGGSMSIVVGIVVVAAISWIVCVFGMRFFHLYERWAWIPQLIVLFILIGRASPHFNISSQSVGAVTANRLSFFSLILFVPVSWSGAASDFYVYYPETTSRTATFAMTFTGLWLSFCLVDLIGVGLGSGVAVVPAWQDAYNVSIGDLILAGYGDDKAFRGFGKFCAVVIALGGAANMIPSTYAAALGCQVLGRYGKAVPRYLWVCVVTAVFLVCAIAGRNSLVAIFENFLAIMGYWIVIFVSIVLEEHLIFRAGPGGRRGFDWTAWEDRKRLPVGLAAITAFLTGWAGALIGMYQVWYIGVVAKRIEGGADVGVWLGSGFALVSYPPLRYLELKFVGR